MFCDPFSLVRGSSIMCGFWGFPPQSVDCLRLVSCSFVVDDACAIGSEINIVSRLTIVLFAVCDEAVDLFEVCDESASS